MSDLEFNYENISEQQFFERQDSRITVLSGSNNSGKSYLLKELLRTFEEKAYFSGTNRLFDVGVLPKAPMTADYHREKYLHFRKTILDKQDYNNDAVTFPFQDLFTRLTNDEREKVLSFVTDCLGETAKVVHEQANNSFSDASVEVGGVPLALCSSGTRLLMFLASMVYYGKVEYVLLDEPEMGLTPRIQSVFQSLLYDNTGESFPHLKHIYIATHSHIFLNQKRVSDNFLVERENKTINVKRLDSLRDLRSLQFTQLGNSFEHMQLPSGFCIVEGDTDTGYIKRVLAKNVPHHRWTIVNASMGDGRIPQKVWELEQVLGSIPSSPYSDRILILMDKTHSASVKDKLSQKGLTNDHFVVWDMNGIEHYYPENLLREVFRDDKLTAKNLRIVGDDVMHNDIVLTKRQLSDLILEKYQGHEALDDELKEFIEKIAGKP